MHHKMDGMHIGIDCRLATYQMGGISQYTIHLIQAIGELNSGGERFTIFHNWREKRNFLPKKISGFSRSELLTPPHHPLERYAMSVELARHRLDLFHSPDFIPPLFGARRKVITVHDLTFMYFPQFLTAESCRYYHDQIEWAVGEADHIIADSDSTRSDLVKLLQVNSERVTTIHLAANPVYLEKYTEDEITGTLAGFALKRGFILTVGTLEPRKNLPMLLNAYKRLRHEFGVDVPLVLVGGKGWMFEDIFQTIHSLGLDSCVRHLSGVSDRSLAHLYRAAGLLAFPSLYEGFGLPALEAMHCACPVVASNRGSLPEVVGPAAVTLDPDDIDAWVKALHLVLSDSEFAASLSSAGLARSKLFSWRKAAAETMAVYQSQLEA